MTYLFLFIMILTSFLPVNSQSLDQLAEECNNKLSDATFLRDFKVELEAAGPGRPEQVARYSMVLNRNTQYRLSICNSETPGGEGIIKLFDSRSLIGSNYVESTGTSYPYFDVQISSTGVYHIFISFKDGLPGKAVGVLSFVTRL